MYTVGSLHSSGQLAVGSVHNGQCAQWAVYTVAVYIVGSVHRQFICHYFIYIAMVKTRRITLTCIMHRLPLKQDSNSPYTTISLSETQRTTSNIGKRWQVITFSKYSQHNMINSLINKCCKHYHLFNIQQHLSKVKLYINHWFCLLMFIESESSDHPILYLFNLMRGWKDNSTWLGGSVGRRWGGC